MGIAVNQAPEYSVIAARRCARDVSLVEASSRASTWAWTRGVSHVFVDVQHHCSEDLRSVLETIKRGPPLFLNKGCL